MSVTITVRYEDGDGSKLDEMEKRLNRAKRSTAEVGFHDAASAQVAAFNQFGTEDAPARPFMSKAFEDNLDDLKDEGRKQLSAWAIEGKGRAGDNLRAWGNTHQRHIQKTIKAGMSPPNVKDEGAPGSLEVTGQMAASVRVKLGGGG